MMEIILLLIGLAIIGFFGGILLDIVMSLFPYILFGSIAVVIIWLLNSPDDLDTKLDFLEYKIESTIQGVETFGDTLERRYGDAEVFVPSPPTQPELMFPPIPPQPAIRINQSKDY